MAVAKLNQQDLSERLRRRLGLAGSVEPTIDLTTSISLDAGSLFEPGLSVFKGRRWCLSLSTAVSGGPNHIQLQPQVDVVITGFRFQCATTAGSVVLCSAANVACAQRNSIFTESPPAQASPMSPEVPPIFDCGVSAAGLPASLGAYYTGVLKDQAVDFDGILIRGASGGLQNITIEVSAALAAGFTANLYGYIAKL